MTAGPLAGVRVVELGGIGPVPFAAMVLADLGADVVRVHRPGEAVVNPVLDRGRRSIAVDLKDPRGAEVVRSLIARSDAVLEGFRPGVAERLGFAPAELRRTRPALVVGRMTGYGQDGPLAPRAGHDINYIALSGVLASVGRADAAPVPPLNLVGDFGGGGMLLALGVLAAILSARTTGQGQDVDAAMVDGSALLTAMIHGFRAMGSWSGGRGENLLDTGAPFYDTYACADGGYVAVGAIEPEFFARDEWAERFSGKDACVTPVLDFAEAPRDPHNVSRGTFFTDESGVVHPAPAPRFSGTSVAKPACAPVPGQHTDELLREIGMDAAKLRHEGVVT